MKSRDWPRTLLKMGSWILLACAALHMAGHIQGLDAKPRNDAERQLFQSLDTYVLPDIGRTPRELMNGFSLTFSLFCVAVGWVGILAARHADAELARRLARAASVVLIAASAVGLTHWFFAPNTFLIAAAVAFTGSWLLPRRAA